MLSKILFLNYLHFSVIFRLPFLSIFIFLAFSSFAQSLEWRYEYDTGESTRPAYFWIDADGNGYFNVYQQKPGSPSTFDRSHSLLILNEDGLYNGSVYIQNCKRGGLMLPFGNDQYVVSGTRCSADYESPRRTFLLSYEGNILKEDKAFKGNYFARTPSEYGATFFSKPTKNFSHTFLSIGTVNKAFEMSFDSIPLKPIEKDGVGMVFNYIDPVQLENKNWILPFNYGKLGNGISIDHGSVFCVQDKKIAWQYPDTLSDYSLKHIASYENTVTVYMRKRKNVIPKLFVQLDQDGKVIQELIFQPKNRKVLDMAVDKNHIILLYSNLVSWFDWSGQLVKEFDLGAVKISALEMAQTEEGALIISGRHYGKATFVKINTNSLAIPDELKDETSDTLSQKELELEREIRGLEIQYAEASLASQEVFSASVFPNPTSLRINFELSGIEDKPSDFLLEVFDLSGKSVFKDQFNSNFYELNVSSFIAGSYVYRITSSAEDSKEFITGKFIKV